MFCLVEIFVRKLVGIQHPIKIGQSFIPHNTFARSRGTRANITAMTRYSTHAFTSTSSSSYLSSQRQPAPLTRRKSCHPQRGLMNKFAADEAARRNRPRRPHFRFYRINNRYIRTCPLVSAICTPLTSPFAPRGWCC